MRIGIAGAGAVGCLFGGLLQQAGHHVTFLARGNHLEALKTNGLMIAGEGEVLHINRIFTDKISSLSECELILFCVKSNDTKSMAKQLLPFLKKNARILTMQNGVDNEELLCEIFGSHRVLSAATYVQAFLEAPGKVRQQGRVKLVIGELDNLTTKECLAVVQAFQQANIDTGQSHRILERKWKKLLWNITFNPLSAIVNARVGQVLDDEYLRKTAACIAKESIEVATHAGISIDFEETFSQIFKNAEHARTHQTSMLQDRLQGKRMEVEAICGFISRKGQTLSVPTPTINTVYRLLKFLDQQPTVY